MGNLNLEMNYAGSFLLTCGKGNLIQFVLLTAIINALLISFCVSFNPYVDSFKTLNYRPVLDRRKRSIDENVSNQPVKLRFNSHNRTFNLKLFPIEQDIFTDNFIIDVDGQNSNEQIKPHDFLYNGYVDDDPSSFVYGSILDGIFDGHIILGNGQSFTVEKVSKYFGTDQRPTSYHSFIYLDDHINHRNYYRTKRSVNDENTVNDDSFDNELGYCGLNEAIKKQMRQIQGAVMPLEDGDYPAFGSSVLTSLMHFDDPKYNRLNKSKRRVRRDIPRSGNEFKNVSGRLLYGVRTCTIYLQADQKLYESIFFKEGNQSHIRTREEIMSLFYTHIKAVNQIYEATDFGGVHGLNFVIQRTSIYTKDTCFNGKPVPGSDNPFCEENVDVSNYLNLNSQRNHSAFCLAYALTFRDFIGGTLGLAWVASPTFNTAGGICQMYQKYNEGQHGTAYRSLNTGIVTLVNYGNRVPLRVSQLTMAHEIGHNFGAPHDQTSECQPGLPDGNYIMFASATSGDKINNAKFSRCSINSIRQVLYEVLQQPPADADHLVMPLFGKKRNCFQERKSAFCGNQIHEPGEECDCGYSQSDCDEMGDNCCAPRESPDGCSRKSKAVCSPSEGSCCNSASCSFYRASDNQRCREESECLFSQTCSGTSPACPESEAKPDGLSCQDVTKVCRAGSCNGSICEEVGLKDCFLTEGKPSQLCHLACEKNGTCLSSFDLPEFAAGKYKQKGRENQPGLLLHPGSPCNNYKGYCDILRKCRSVDSNGPLARLKNLLFNKHTIKSVSQWVQEHWWACVIIGICVLLFMALFVKCCAVHTPSTNPNKLPAQNLSDTLRHPGTLLRRGRSNPRATGAYTVGGSAQLNGVVSMSASGNSSSSRNVTAANGRSAAGGGHHRAHHQRQQRHKDRRDNRANRQHNRGRSSSSQNPQPAGSSSTVAAASSRQQFHGAASWTPANLSAPPLIPSPPGPAVVAPPPPQIFSPIHEPPPPYTPTDPALSSLPSASMAVSPILSTSNADGKNNTPVAMDSTSTTALIARSSNLPAPVVLPGAPLQPTSAAAASSSSIVPLVPGPPLPGQGPRPGRRRPKQIDEAPKKTNIAQKTNKRAVK